ncbi:6-phosphogluconolactonase [Lipingzhangella sp. LS1_29]|uniref:6-phosphogluconolactonase n=1 Tax=Lipingzhangella rawalii TaxID=2055835 RepID=A0ABU2H0C3_9ACTN|nr:6-phosphogluconolactonase [Lipingzhangella rawalii]MDS1268750.1 6-phosphogluconolactonase [Lipingzhangella rawalii]
MSHPSVVIHPDGELLARATAARLVTRIVDAQAARGAASVVLTGGGIGIATLEQLAVAPARDAVDWQRLDVWWGDERFLPRGDPDRNETQARAALLDRVPLDPNRIRPFAASDDADEATPERAAEQYAQALRHATRAQDHAPVPWFDVCLLGIGPDAHVASLFPEQPAVYEEERSVVAVHGAPKPPPTRLTLTFPAIRNARQVWLLAAGAAKAPAVRLAVSGGGPVQVPAAGAWGREQTLYLVDESAAGELPRSMASPGVL